MEIATSCTIKYFLNAHKSGAELFSTVDTDTDFPRCPHTPGLCLLPLHYQRYPGMRKNLVITQLYTIS